MRNRNHQDENVYPLCEKCWIEENSIWEPDGVSEDGRLVTRLVKVAIPLNIMTGKINFCCMCGNLTVVGIYVEKRLEDIKYDKEPLDTFPDM